MVAIEALTHGLAIVGSRIGGLSDVTMENGEGANARLFDLADGDQGMAEALRPLLLDSGLLLSCRKASLSMAHRFDLEHSLDAYERVLKGVCR